MSYLLRRTFKLEANLDHVRLREPVRSVLVEIANDLRIPLRSCNSEIGYVGNFYGQAAEGASLPDLISVNGLIEILRELPDGISELGFPVDLP